MIGTKAIECFKLFILLEIGTYYFHSHLGEIDIISRIKLDKEGDLFQFKQRPGSSKLSN